MGDLRGQLRAFLTDRLPSGTDPDVSEPVDAGGGSSKLNWAFDATWNRDGTRRTHELMLRQEPAAGVVETELAQEFAVLAALGRTGLPVPTGWWADLDAEWFERPSIVVARAGGQAHRAVLRDKDPLGLGAAAQYELARTLADLLADVHAVDIEDAGLDAVLGSPGPDPAAAELERWEHELDTEKLDPGNRLGRARDWLRAHLPSPPRALSLVHGDFRPANVLVDDGLISALLDWELAHLGDPCDDLGWYTCSIYRVEHFPAGWSVEDLLERYADRGGELPDPLRLRFWQILSVFRLAVIALRGARNVELGRVPGPPPPVDRVLTQLLADIEA